MKIETAQALASEIVTLGNSVDSLQIGLDR